MTQQTKESKIKNYGYELDKKKGYEYYRGFFKDRFLKKNYYVFAGKNWQKTLKDYNHFIKVNFPHIEGLKDDFGERFAAFADYPHDKKGSDFVLCVFSYNTGTILHEITHLAIEAFEEKDTPINRQNTEMFAHYVDYLYRSLNPIVLELRNKNI